MAWRGTACHATPCHPRAHARPSILFRPPDLTTPTTRLVCLSTCDLTGASPHGGLAGGQASTWESRGACAARTLFRAPMLARWLTSSTHHHRRHDVGLRIPCDRPGCPVQLQQQACIRLSYIECVMGGKHAPLQGPWDCCTERARQQPAMPTSHAAGTATGEAMLAMLAIHASDVYIGYACLY